MKLHIEIVLFVLPVFDDKTVTASLHGALISMNYSLTNSFTNLLTMCSKFT